MKIRGGDGEDNNSSSSSSSSSSSIAGWVLLTVFCVGLGIIGFIFYKKKSASSSSTNSSPPPASPPPAGSGACPTAADAYKSPCAANMLRKTCKINNMDLMCGPGANTDTGCTGPNCWFFPNQILTTNGGTKPVPSGSSGTPATSSGTPATSSGTPATSSGPAPTPTCPTTDANFTMARTCGQLELTSKVQCYNSLGGYVMMCTNTFNSEGCTVPPCWKNIDQVSSTDGGTGPARVLGQCPTTYFDENTKPCQDDLLNQTCKLANGYFYKCEKKRADRVVPSGCTYGANCWYETLDPNAPPVVYSERPTFDNYCYSDVMENLLKKPCPQEGLVCDTNQGNVMCQKYPNEQKADPECIGPLCFYGGTLYMNPDSSYISRYRVDPATDTFGTKVYSKLDPKVPPPQWGDLDFK